MDIYCYGNCVIGEEEDGYFRELWIDIRNSRGRDIMGREDDSKNELVGF